MSAKKAKTARKAAPAAELKTVRVMKTLSQDFTVQPDGNAVPSGPSVFTESQKVKIPAGNMYLWRQEKKSAPLSAYYHPSTAPNVVGKHFSADGVPDQLSVIPVYL